MALIYKEASERCGGCRFALATPLEQLPQKRPDPNQTADIMCMAKVEPWIEIQGHPSLYDENKTYLGPDFNSLTLHINYYITGETCVMSPNPNERDCSIAKAAMDVDLLQNTTIVVPTNRFENGEINFNPLQGPVSTHFFR